MKSTNDENATNLEDDLADIFNSHIQELVRRYHAGYDGFETNINQGKIGENTSAKFASSAMSYAEIQYDVEFLRKQADMKEAITDDKNIRKQYRRIMRKEAQRELEKLEIEEKRVRELQENNKTAKPCLVELLEFIINKLVRYFPNSI